MTDTRGLLAMEYEAVNAHLRANIGQFVNWFSFFLVQGHAVLPFRPEPADPGVSRRAVG
jgi:hypothetical protein